MNSYLVLENGEVFEGRSFGSQLTKHDKIYGEVVFQTGMVGYIQSLTDPSYKNQILVLTYPLVGNYGVPDRDAEPTHFESGSIHVSGLVVADYDGIFNHWSGSKSLGSWLNEEGVVGLCGIDTRKLTKIIREYGTMKGWIVDSLESLNNKINSQLPVESPIHQVSIVSRKDVKIINKGGLPKVCVVDCGVKNNQIRMLKERGAEVIIVPYNYNFLDLVFDRLFISNGPGNPEDCMETVDRLREFMKVRPDVPIFGICLGHQLLALASGAKTYKMKYGNRGHNIPCRLVGTKHCYITSQNHGYAVDIDTISDGWEQLYINIDDGSNEGLYHKNKPYFSVQFHPEAKAGPEDTSFLFDVFLNGSKIDLDKIKLEQQKIDIDAKYLRTLKKVLILGSGGLSIGQSGEFDYSGSQAIKAFKEEGMNTILINPNIATVQTSPGFADKVYFLPITIEYVVKIIKIERPDCISLSFGGQTALNCGIELFKNGIFEKYGITVIGPPLQSVIDTEDRDAFAKRLQKIGERVPPGITVSSKREAIAKATQLQYPVLVRAAYTLGGMGSGFVNNEKELLNLLDTSFSYSKQVTLDKSLRGWKEIEFEVVRDMYDNCISVCNMENIDPLGVHTGESIVVAPSQTLNDQEYNMLRTVSLRVIRELKIVGECNIQFALDPNSSVYYIIEVNARLSRSSALASKATGYPLAYIAAKLALGYSLVDLKNSITKITTACFEPSLDYCVVKVPRWDLNKFPNVVRNIDSSMKSIGEAMGIGRTFEEAFQKALRMANESVVGFDHNLINYSEEDLMDPTDTRIFSVANYLGIMNDLNDSNEVDKLDKLNKLFNLTKIDKWFLEKFNNIVEMSLELANKKILNLQLVKKAKMLGFSDKQIAKYTSTTELAVRNFRIKNNIVPFVKQIDTVAAEFPCQTNYLYLTYNGNEHDITSKDITSKDIASKDKCDNPIMVLGSGVYKIGSSVEFDWCAVNCVRELRKLGEHVTMVNCNPETVSTDYDEADQLFFEELSFETVVDIYNIVNSKGVVLAVGGQLPNNIAMALHRMNIKVLGTSPEMVDKAENRYKFSRMLDNVDIDQPVWKELTSIEEAKQFCNLVGYPCLIRPSYVLSGVAMNVAYDDEDLIKYLQTASTVSKDYPIVVTKFIIDAKEVEVDAVAKNGKVKLYAISEHVENAGVHSGDATLILPPQDLTEYTINKIKNSVKKIAEQLKIDGPFNIQFIAKDDQVKVIECNLRVSRTFPYVSKTLGVNFVRKATRIMLGLDVGNIKCRTDKIGVKVPQFSFNRLQGADVCLGVDMVSTGEVACFGDNMYEAFLKGLVSSGFKLPDNNSNKILISIGSYKFKNEFLESIKLLNSMGYKLYGTSGTVDYYNEEGVKIEELSTQTILNMLNDKRINLVINISKKNKFKGVNLNDKITDGYLIRRKTVESSTSLLTDIKTSKLLVKSLAYYAKIGYNILVKTDVDCFTSYTVVRLPGLIDPHVHVRDMEEQHKEDWLTCTKAALAGGITMIGAMPNSKPPVVDIESLKLVDKIARSKACCDYGLYVGATVDNKVSVSSEELGKNSFGLKMYLNNTYGPLILNDTKVWIEHFKNYSGNRPICVHAESQTLAAVLHIAKLCGKSVHVCHVARREEIELIKMSKQLGQDITCEVTPHHLFLCEDNLKKLGCCGSVKPNLVTKDDQNALWENMNIIDCFATDHAPHTIEEKLGCVHTIEEKLGSYNTLPGFPGLETALPLLLTAVKQGRLTINDIREKFYENPMRIFRLPKQEETYIEIDMDNKWTIPNKMRYSKAGWTPFAGMEVYGSIKRVVLRGKVVFVDGEVLATPGFGKNIRDIEYNPNDIKKSYILENSILESNESNESNELNKISKIDTKNVKFGNIISVDQFTKEHLRVLFDKASEMKTLVEKYGRIDLMKDKVISSIFYEPSTRTKCSFTAAMKRLGGEVIEIASEASSVQKGETLEDFVRTMEAYTDLIILRTPEKGALDRVAKVVKVPVINAGDGSGEHPTQALLDIYTIREERGTVNGLTITMVGDLKHGRTVHSLAKLLSLYNVRLRYVSPPGLEMPDDIKQYIDCRGVEQNEHYDINEILGITDVLYVTRIQKERFDNLEDYEKIKDSYVITPELVNLSKTKENMIIMHPLPRVNEISVDIDNDPRATYFRQMQYGMYVRMALITMML